MGYVRAGLQLAVAVTAVLVGAQARGQNVYAPNADPRMVAHLESAWQAAHPTRFDVGAGWSPLGTPVQVSISYVKDGVPIPAPAGVAGGSVNSSLFSTLDSQFAGVGGRSRWQQAIGVPGSPGVETSNFTDGAAFLWDSQLVVSGGTPQIITGSGLTLQFRRRADKGGLNDDPSVNNWDDGTVFGTPGPLGITSSNAINVTLGGALTAATIGVNSTSTSMVISTTPAGAGPFTLDLTAAANDTIAELATAISAIPGLTATADPQISAATASVSLTGSQTFNLSTGSPTHELVIPAKARGDIRIAMRPLPAGVLLSANAPADGGDIILNSTVDWTAGGGTIPFVTLENAVAQGIGLALGLKLVCPSDGTKLMEKSLPTGFVGPQHDEYRALHLLYGDRNEANDTAAMADAQAGSLQIPTPSSTFANDESDKLRLSLTSASDVDFFRLVITPGGSFDFTIVAVPEGATYKTGPADATCAGVTVNSLAAMDIVLGLFDSTGAPIFDGAPTGASTPFTVFSNVQPAGKPETLTGRIANSSGSAKVVYVAVAAAPGSTSAVQLYHLQVKSKNNTASTGDSIGPIISQYFIDSLGLAITDHFGPTGHGALSLQVFPLELDPDFPPIPLTNYNNNYSGTRAVLANIDGGFPDPQHVAFAGKTIAQLQWQGVNPAISGITDHATAVSGPAAGVQIGAGDTFFRGAAPNATLLGVDVASSPIAPSGQFTTSTESLYYGLFAAADPATAAAAGVTHPATVLNVPWGAFTDESGDGVQPRAFDAVVNQTGVTAVVAAGNDGLADFVSTCFDGDVDSSVPGRIFFGARTINSPATAFNIISVGSVTKSFDPSTGSTGNPGGGGGRPGDSGTTRDAENGLPLDTVPQFSSKGPIDSVDFSATFPAAVPNVRPGVHILAAGAGLTIRKPDPTLDTTSGIDPCVLYGPGHYPPSKLLTVPAYDPSVKNEFQGADGTSISASIVSGAVALLQDYGIANHKSIDSLVMKSVLLSGAIKMAGWVNTGFPAKPQDNRDGANVAVIQSIVAGNPAGSTDQAFNCLDFAQGAGVLSIPNSFAIYALGDLTDSSQTDPTKPTAMKPPAVVVTTQGRPGAGGASTVPAGFGVPLHAQETLDPVGHSPLEVANIVAHMDQLERGAVMSPLRRRAADTTDPVLGGGGNTKAGGTVGQQLIGVSSGGTLPPVFGGGSTGGTGTGTTSGSTKLLSAPIQGGAAGWDIGMLGTTTIPGGGKGGYIDYEVDFHGPILMNGIQVHTNFFDATLVWNRNVKVAAAKFNTPDNPQAGQLTTYALDDLALEMYPLIDPINNILGPMIAGSDTKLNNIEHIHWDLPIGQPGGKYILRVRWVGQDYDLFKNSTPGNVKYAVAWGNSDDLPYRVANGLPAPPAARMVGMQALARVLALYGVHAGDAGYDAMSDYNQDGVIDSKDLAWVLTYWPRNNQGGAASN